MKRISTIRRAIAGRIEYYETSEKRLGEYGRKLLELFEEAAGEIFLYCGITIYVFSNNCCDMPHDTYPVSVGNNLHLGLIWF